VDTFKPLLKGTDLAKALNTKPGPWMKEALDVVMAWQLRNPDSTDTTAAIEAVKASRSEKNNDSELPLALASHFLQLTIPPLFPQNKPTSNALEASRQPAPWKDAGNTYALDLLEWTIGALDKKTIEAKWHFLMPPILKMMDDIDVKWRAKGCHMLGLLLEALRQPSTTVETNKMSKVTPSSSNFLQRTGYHNIFAEALMPMFTYIPSITPESESLVLFKEVFPATIPLALLLSTEATKGDNRERFLDKILREGVLTPLAHFPTPSSYPKLATLILSHVPGLLGHMGIGTVKHLPDLVPLLSVILSEPFVLLHKPLVLETLKAVQSVLLNAWPRIPAHRGAIMMGLTLLWARCTEEQAKPKSQDVENVKVQVKETVAMLDAIMRASEENELWETEKRDVVQASDGYGDLFGECVQVTAAS
jgi:tRNA nucleotidyltransferase (CCA-adding enzyme)